jgi:hypothetical protein
LLTGAFTPETTFDEDDWRSRGGAFNLRPFAPENFPRNLQVVEALKGIAARRGKRVSHLALRWVLTNPAVSVALVGCRTIAEVEDNLGALDWTLSAEELEEMEMVFREEGIDVTPDVWLE